MATPLNAPPTADIIARATALFDDLSLHVPRANGGKPRSPAAR